MAQSTVTIKKVGLVVSGLLIGLTIISLAIQSYIDFSRESESDSTMYKSIAVLMIIVWVGIVISYYAWALHFYHINYGWTEKRWQEQEEARASNPAAERVEPTENPNKAETLGLPTGTVRGTLAISLLVIGLALLVASFSFESKLQASEYLVDNFEYIKTAFLLMIAFYFGNKSLEFLKDRKMVIGTTGTEVDPNVNGADLIAKQKAIAAAKDGGATEVKKRVASENPVKNSVAGTVVETETDGPAPSFADPNSVG